MAKKPIVTTLQSGFNSTEVLNSNFENLRDGFDNTLSLDGSTPNAMGADLDLSNNKILNAEGIYIGGVEVLTTITAIEAATLGYAGDALASKHAAATSASAASTDAATAYAAATNANVVAVGTDLNGTNTIGTVAASIADVNLLGPVSTQIGLLGTADAVSDMNTLAVAGVIDDLSLTANAANAGWLESVSDNMTAILANYMYRTQIGDVANNSTNINTVAGKATEIGLLGTAAAVADMDLLGVPAVIADMDVLAPIQANITTVSNIQGNVTSVAGVAGDVTTVAGINQLHLSAVANVAAEVSAVANISNNVSTVAGVSTYMQPVAAIDDNISTVAGIANNVSTVAGISANVTTVASSISSVNTVSDNISVVDYVGDVDRMAAVIGVAVNMTSVINAVASATAAANSATASAGSATAAAGSATTSNDDQVLSTAAKVDSIAAKNDSVTAKDASVVAKDAALVAQAAAEAARDTTYGLTDTYPDTAAGLAATTDTEYFTVVGSGLNYIELYLNNSGSAVLQRSLYADAKIDEMEDTQAITTLTQAAAIAAIQAAVIPATAFA